MAMLAAILIVGGLGGAAFHPPAAALAHRLGGERAGLAMSVHITGGTLGFSMGPLLFAPFAQRFGLAVDAAPRAARPGGRRVLPDARLPACHAGTTSTTRWLPRAPAVRTPLDAALLHRRAADADVDFVRDVHAGDADQPRHVAGVGGQRRGDLPVRQRHRRILRRARRRSLRGATGDRPVAGLRRAVPVRSRRSSAAGCSSLLRGDRRVLPAVDAAGERHVRPGAGAGERGDGVVADDGLRLGHRRPERAVRRA